MSTSRLFHTDEFQNYYSRMQPEGNVLMAKTLEDIDNSYFYLTLPSNTYRDLLPLHKVMGSFYHDFNKNNLNVLYEKVATSKKHEHKTIEDAIKDLEETADYNENVSYLKFGDEYFVTDRRNINSYARSKMTVSINALVRQYNFDHELFCAYQKLSQYFCIELDSPEQSEFPRHNQYIEWRISYKNKIDITLSGRENVINFCNYFLLQQPTFWKQIKWWMGFRDQENCVESFMKTAWPLNKNNKYLLEYLECLFSDIKKATPFNYTY